MGEGLNARAVSEWFDDEVPDKESSEADDDKAINEIDDFMDDKYYICKLIPAGPEQDDNIETRENTFQENM